MSVNPNCAELKISSASLTMVYGGEFLFLLMVLSGRPIIQ
jgi:hypothetical protein